MGCCARKIFQGGFFFFSRLSITRNGSTNEPPNLGMWLSAIHRVSDTPRAGDLGCQWITTPTPIPPHRWAGHSLPYYAKLQNGGDVGFNVYGWIILTLSRSVAAAGTAHVPRGLPNGHLDRSCGSGERATEQGPRLSRGSQLILEAQGYHRATSQIHEALMFTGHTRGDL